MGEIGEREGREMWRGERGDDGEREIMGSRRDWGEEGKGNVEGRERR